MCMETLFYWRIFSNSFQTQGKGNNFLYTRFSYPEIFQSCFLCATWLKNILLTSFPGLETIYCVCFVTSLHFCFLVGIYVENQSRLVVSSGLLLLLHFFALLRNEGKWNFLTLVINDTDIILRLKVFGI